MVTMSRVLSLLKSALVVVGVLAAGAGIAVALLIFVFDLQWELDGSSRPMFSLGGSPEEHLRRSRVEPQPALLSPASSPAGRRQSDRALLD